MNLDRVPMWTDKAGHILMWTERVGDDIRWTQTLCGIFSNRYGETRDRPKRICKTCRELLPRAIPKETTP